MCFTFTIRFKTNHLLRMHCKNQPENKCESCLREFCTKMEYNAHKQMGCKLPSVEQNYSMVQLIADSIKVELNEPIPENLNSNEKEIKTSSAQIKNSENQIDFGSIETEKNELGETVHKCPVCFKCFRKRWNLMEHLQRHSQKRPYKCWLCAKT